MKKFGLLSSSAIGSAALFGLSMAFAAPALAQDTTAAAEDLPAAEEPASDQVVEVTGSRIRRPNLESTVPITSLTGDQIFQQGDTNIGEVLNELPQLRSTFAQQNPGLGIGIAGLNLLDLRGLGTQRTLVLVNGRRHVPSDILNNAVSPDINSIPNDLIERIDIVTGGNSAIYGSDAIAGVVNFVLRRDYEGLQIRGNAAMTEEGFGGNQYISAMYGMNFADGRGNVTVHGEYAHQERVFASDIPWFRQQDGLFVVDADSAGLDLNGDGRVDNADGFPDRIFLRNIRSSTIHFNSLVPINQQADNPNAPGLSPTGACGNGIAANNTGPSPFGPNPNSNSGHGNPYNCTYIFTAAGRLIQQTGTRFGAGINSGIIGGNGQSGREGNLVSAIPFLERYNFNLLGHYTFSDALELFVEAKYNRVNAQGNNAGPSFNQGTSGTGDFRERPRLDNPFLNPADRATLAAAILASGCRSDLLVICNPFLAVPTGVLTPTDQANIANGSFRFVASRLLADVGLRDEHFERETIRVVTGLRGTFNEDWNYEVSANWGRFKEAITTGGFIDRQRFSLAMDAGLDPVTNTIRCRSQYDLASAIQLQAPAPGTSSAVVQAGNAARLAADIAACRPYNPFGAPDNSAAVDYFARTFTANGELRQLVFSGFVSGDLSQLFELPGGPIRFALGAEYRREEAFYRQDQFITDGFANGVSIPAFPENRFTVKEAFGELQIPLLRDMPFFHELTVTGAARVAKYQGNVGTVWSYNGGAEWAPIRDVRFRGNYSRAVRAPNVSETASPLIPNFFNNFQDPCDPIRRNAGTSLRLGNCTNDLGAAVLATLVDVTTSLPIVSGSNPNLTEETSDSYTFGAVIQPRWIPGLSLTVDYYDITVNGIIANIGVQTLVNNCYDLPRPNPFCGQFQRNGAGLGPNGEQPGRILNNTLISAPLNFAARTRRGIDFNVVYRTNITPDVRFNTNLIYTHNLEISNFEDPANPSFENRILGELGDPVDEFRWDVDLAYREFTLGYRMRYIGPMWTNTYENFNALNGTQAGAAPPGGNDADWSEPRKYNEIFYHDLRFEWNIRNTGGFADGLMVYFGVDNVLDTRPPLGTTGLGVGSAIYDIRGRNFYGGFRARF